MIEFINKAFSKIRQIEKDITKARKSARNIFSQKKMRKKMDRYVDDFLTGKIERFSAVPKKPELIGKKIIWQYWHQEINDNTPKVVISCLNSVKKNNCGYDIILLTGNNLNEYIDLPDFIYKKLGKGGYNLTKLSNLVRLYLLSAYGGVWLDATIYLTKPFEEDLRQKDFFVLQRSETPPPDADIYLKFDPIYFSWDPAFQVRMLNSFIIAKPGNKIVNDLLSILLEYWKREKRILHYFFFQICFNRMIQRDEWKDLNCQIISDTCCHKFQTAASETFDRRLYDEIAAGSNIHKLTIFEKYFAKRRIPAGSFADILTNGFP